MQGASGTEVAIAGAKTTAAGMILMANSAQNKSGGYERGNTSSGKSSEITFTQGTPGKERKVTVKIPEGYRKTNYKSHGQSVYTNGKNYISPDRDGHNGGIWKMAKDEKLLKRKETRMGTYDVNLNRVGD